MPNLRADVARRNRTKTRRVPGIVAATPECNVGKVMYYERKNCGELQSVICREVEGNGSPA